VRRKSTQSKIGVFADADLVTGTEESQRQARDERRRQQRQRFASTRPGSASTVRTCGSAGSSRTRAPIDLEIIGLQPLLARETREALARRGFDVSRYEPVPFPHPLETRTARGRRGKRNGACATERLSRGRQRDDRSSSDTGAARCSGCAGRRHRKCRFTGISS
jgi:hypothetical protein